MKTRQFIILGSALVLLIGAFFGMQYLTSLKKDPPRRKPQATKTFVQTRTVAYSQLPANIQAFGRVRTAQPLDLAAEVAGRLLPGQVTLREGASFSKGTVLFKVDDTEAKLTLQAAKSTFLKDIAAILPDLKIDYAARFATWESFFNAIEPNKPLPELPEPATNQEKTFLASRNILTSYYNILRQEANLEKYVIRAPFAGSITEVFLQEGGYAGPGVKVLKLIRRGALELIVPVQTSDVRWVKQGKSVSISTEDGEMKWNGRVARIADLVNPQTQALDIYVDITSGDGKLYDGMYLKATLEGGKVERAMEFPRSALVDGGQRVYILAQDSILQKREVQIHKINEETVFFSGLPEGATVVSEALTNVNENQVVFSLRDVKGNAAAPEETAQKEEVNTPNS